MKIGYKRLSIEKLETRYGMSKNEATAVWNRTYRQALRETKGYNNPEERLNISKELHNSLFYNGNQVFDVDLSQTIPNARLHSGLSGTDLKRDFVALRFESMADKYQEIDVLVKQYLDGTISYEDFLNKVEIFRKTNKEYLTQEYHRGD